MRTYEPPAPIRCDQHPNRPATATSAGRLLCEPCLAHMRLVHNPPPTGVRSVDRMTELCKGFADGRLTLRDMQHELLAFRADSMEAARRPLTNAIAEVSA